MWRSVSVSCTSSSQASPGARRAAELVDRQPPTSTARDSGRSRAPLQAGHGTSDMNSSIFSRDELRVRLAVAALRGSRRCPRSASSTSAGGRSGSCRRCRRARPWSRAGTGPGASATAPPTAVESTRMLGDRVGDLLVVVGGSPPTARSRPRPATSRGRGRPARVDLHLGSEPGAALAGAVGRVEREDPRLELGDRPARGRGRRTSREYSVVPGSPSPSGTVSISTMPSARPTAVSIESASRLRTSSRMTRRSTTTEMSCLYFLSRTISSSSIRSSPSTLTRWKPSARSSSKTLPYSPLRPRTIGARTMKRAPSASSMTWSMICSADWPATGLPQMWQCGWPIRDHSRRR